MGLAYFGLAGDDDIVGGDGDDILVGGEGADFLDGGAGTDTASYISSGRSVNVALGDVDNAGDPIPQYVFGGDAEGDQLSDIENLFGSRYNDALGGDNGNNVIWGYAGSDLLWGSRGNDVLYGGSGGDDLHGGVGRDMLSRPGRE